MMYFKALQEDGYDYFKMRVSLSRQVVIVRRQSGGYSYILESSEGFNWVRWSISTQEEFLIAFQEVANNLIDIVEEEE